MKKRMVITGGTSGIGRATVEQMLSLNWQVTVLARNSKAIQDLLNADKESISFIYCDLLQPDSIRSAAAQLLDDDLRIDVLVNNAGAWFMSHELTPEGNEQTFALNHLSHFFLTKLLLDRLMESKSRIINVSSNAHKYARLDFSDLNWTKRKYKVFKAYGTSKLANIHYAETLNRKFSKNGLTAFSLHPGIVGSNFGHSTGGFMSRLFGIAKPFMINNHKGAKTTVYLAQVEDIDRYSGQYFYKSKPAKPARHARDQHISDQLWEVSEEIISSW